MASGGVWWSPQIGGAVADMWSLADDRPPGEVEPQVSTGRLDGANATYCTMTFSQTPFQVAMAFQVAMVQSAH